MNKFQEVLRRIDIFGQTISFNFRREDVYRTSFGGFMSIAIIGLIISFFYSNIISFFAMTQVTSTQQMSYIKNPPEVELSQQNFMFAVQIEQTNFTGNPYFNITVEQRYYNRLANGTVVRNIFYVDLVPCTVNHFQPIFTKYQMNITDEFTSNNLKDFLCPSLNSPKLSIQGAWTSTDYRFLKVSVVSCKNQTNSNFTWQPVCKSQTDVSSFLKSSGSFRFQMFTVNYIFNPQKSQNDIIPFIDQELFYNFVPDQMFVQADIFFRKRTVTTDSGILMVPNLETEILPSRDAGDYRQQIAINQLTSGFYAAFYPQVSPYSYKINRQYFRLDQLLSYLGGFLQFVIVVVGILVKFYNRQHMIVAMANDLFEFQLTNHSAKEQGDIREFISKTINFKQKKNNDLVLQEKAKLDDPIISSNIKQSDTPIITKKLSDESSNNGKATHNRLEQIKIKSSKYFVKFKEIMQRASNIPVSLRFIIGDILDKEEFLDEQSLLLRKATQQIQQELDVGFILKQLYEIEKLKQVLFQKDQQDLFNFSQRPLIIINKNRKKKYTRMLSIYRRDGEVFDAQRKQYNNLVNSYRRISSLHVDQMTDEQLRFNTRLINLLGTELPDLIEKELDDFGNATPFDNDVIIHDDDDDDVDADGEVQSNNGQIDQGHEI